MDKAIRKIAVLGTGNMGPGVATLFAKSGFPVTVWAHSASGRDKALADCETIAQDLSDNGLLTGEERLALAGRIVVTEDLEAAVVNSDFISESIVEDLEAKRRIIGQIQRICSSQPIIASNTSTLLPSSLQEGARDPGSVLVAHFWNPAHLVPLVEVCGGTLASTEVKVATVGLLSKVGKDPVVMEKEILGFIGNRLMHAMYREALSLVHEGIIDAEGIDRVVLSSFGPRFANLGPMEYLDYIGLDHIRRIQGYLYSDLEAAGGTTKEIERLNSKGDLGVKTGAGLYDWSTRNSGDVRRRRDAEFLRRQAEG
jgi:3-hydroxybutyryl-CoA dehydrogenase